MLAGKSFDARRCDRLDGISGVGCHSTYAHALALATRMTSGGRSTLTPRQNVETEFTTHAATALHNNSCSRAVATTYLSHTLQTTISSAHVFTPIDSFIHAKLTDI